MSSESSAASTDEQLPYRRRIEVRRRSGGLVGELEDCHHHFLVHLEVEGTTVRRAWAEDRRAPWTTCGRGASGVRALEGLDLQQARSGTWARPRNGQCVHAVDLTRVALAHAEDHEDLRYDVIVAPACGPRQRATLLHNGELALAWELDEGMVIDPQPFAGSTVTGGSLLAAARRLRDPLVAEQVFVLRRACAMAVSVMIDLDRFPTAGDIRQSDGSCWTYDGPRSAVALRRRGTSRPGGLSEPRGHVRT